MKEPQVRPGRGRPRKGVREAVLTATVAILDEAGVARLSTKEVARRAGVAESSIFYHFGDRLGLLQAVVTEQLPPVAEAFEDLDRRDLREGLIVLLGALEAFYLHTMPIAAAIEADGDLRASFADRSQELGAGPHRAVEAMVSYLAARQPAGGVRPDLDLHAAALVLTGAAHERAVLRRFGAPARLAPLRSVVDVLLPVLTP